MPSSILYEDNNVMAFLDIRPLTKGHALVIPKNHYVDLFDISNHDLQAVHTVAKALAIAIKNAISADGISIIQQNGKAAGQEIFHIHVHVIPRYEGQFMPNVSELNIAKRSELAEIALKIRRCMGIG